MALKDLIGNVIDNVRHASAVNPYTTRTEEAYKAQMSDRQKNAETRNITSNNWRSNPNPQPQSRFTKDYIDARKSELEQRFDLVEDRDVTSQLPSDGMCLAVVNNKFKSGTHSTPYGFLESHADGLADGTIIRVDNKGNYWTVEQDDATEDYKAQVQKFKDDYNEAKDKFELSKQFQKMAEEGKDIADPEDHNKVLDSLLDIVAGVKELSDEHQEFLKNAPRDEHGNIDMTFEQYKQEHDKIDAPANPALFEGALSRKGVQYVQDKMVSNEWAKLYKENPMKAINKLNSDTTMSDTLKKYTAYKMLKQSQEDTIGDYAAAGAVNTLMALGEDLDWLANSVKATVLYLDYKGDHELDLAKGYEHLFQNKSFNEVLDACTRATWENEGRITYQYNTGTLPFDFALEMISDPETWLSFGASALAKGAAGEAAETVTVKMGREIGEQVAGESNIIARVFKRAVREGMDESEIVSRIVSRLPEDAQSGTAKVLMEAMDTSKAWKISKSLGDLKQGKEAIDKLMLWGSGLPLGGKVVKEAVDTITQSLKVDIVDIAHIINDAATETLGNVSKDRITIDCATQFFDRVNKNTLAACLDDLLPEYQPLLNNSQKLGLIQECYNNDLVDVYKQTADYFKNAHISVDDIRATDIYAHNKSVLDKKVLNVLEVQHMEDTPLYKILSTKGYSPVSFADPKAETRMEAARSLMADTDRLNVIGERIESTVDRVEDLDGIEAAAMTDKLYVPKVNTRTLGEAYIADKNIRTITDAMYEGDFGALSVAASESTTGTANVTRDVLRGSIGSRNYTRIKNTIEALNVDRQTKDLLTDVLYNDSLKNRASQIFAGAAEYNDDYAYKYARSYAKAMEEEALSLSAWYNSIGKMEDWGCNTYDTVSNVDNIKQALDSMHGTMPGWGKYDRYVIYSSAISSDADFINMTLLFEDGHKVTCTTADEIDDALLELMTSRSEVSPVHLVSFNNHSQGFDTDNYVRRFLMNKDCHAKQWFRYTEDLGACYRIEQGGIDAFSNETTDKLEQAIYDSIKEWGEDNTLLANAGISSRCSFTPPTYDDLHRWQMMLEDTVTANANEKALYDTLAPAITEYVKDDDLSNAILRHHGGVFKGSEYLGSEMWNAGNAQLGIKLVYDQKTISRYINIDGLSVAEAMNYFEDAKHIDTLRKMQWNQMFIDKFADDANELYDEVVPKLGLRYNAKTTEDKIAVMSYLYKQDPTPFYKAQYGWDFSDDYMKFKEYRAQKAAEGTWVRDAAFTGERFKSAKKELRFIEALENQNEWLYKPHLIQTAQEVKPGEWEHINELLPGSIDNPYASYNKINQLCKDVDSLDRTFDTLREFDNFRRANGLEREGAVVNLKRKNKLFEAYAGLKEELRDTIYSNYLHKQSDILFEAETEMQHFIGEAFSPRGIDDINKDMVHWYTDKANYALSYISKLSDDEFTSYIGYHCHGRMVINNELLTDADRVLLESRPNLEIKSTERFTTVRYTGSLNSIEDICPVAEDWFECNTKLPNQITESISVLSEFNDKSFRTGLPLANDEGMFNFINNKFFPGEEFDEFKYTSDYQCAYIGNIYDVLGEGSYASGSVYSNIFNSYARTLNKMDVNELYLDMMFDGRKLSDYCGKSKLEDVLAGLDRADKRLVVRDGDKLLTGDIDYARYMDKEIFVCDSAEWKYIKDQINECKVDTKLMRALKAVRRLESPWISGYLFVNPGTWMHNWVDSTTKAVLSEGTDHFHYMLEATYTGKAFDEVLADCGEAFHKQPSHVTYDDIQRFLSRSNGKYADKISDTRIKQIYAYKQSAISGTMFDDAIMASDAKWINSKMFSKCESTNRLAIYLKHMDEGDSVGQAYEAIKMSQFDYAKNTALTALDSLMPFSTFKLYNYKFWMNDVWQKSGAPRAIKALTSIYNKDGISDRYENYWSEEAMTYRAWIDTLDFDRNNQKYNYEYNTFDDFWGSPISTADANGWIKIADKMYFKLGLSLVEGLGAISFITDAGSSIFSPVTTLPKFFDGVQHQDMLFSGDDKQVSQWLSDYGYDVANMIPIVGTAYYMLQSAVRNYKLYDRLNEDGVLSWLAILLPGMFAPGDYKAPKEYNLPTNKPIGFNWYDIPEEQRKMYQYINGASYVKSWVAKDPASYINHWGRLQQMTGFDNEQMKDFMDLAGGFWFTQNNDGEYQLHNYQLMIGDQQMYDTLYERLTGMYQWSDAKARELLDTAAISMWKRKQYSSGGKYYQGNSARALRYGYGRYKSVYIPAGKGKYTIHPKPRMMSDFMVSGKNVKQSEYALKRQQNNAPIRMPRAQRNNYRWHRRTRDIYKNNYAKYGASRMAMEQNLKNYSNRSITEMRRTNQSLRYNDIHRHVSW